MNKKTLSDILEWIENNITSNVTIEHLTNMSGYSRRFIHNLFKKYLDVSPGQYIRQRKLCMAANLLKLTSQTANKIALDLGFSSEQSFSREFKKNFGVPPKQYRTRGYWNTSQLLPPLKAIDRFNGFISHGEVISMPDITLEGFELIYTEPLPYKACNRQGLRKSSILKHINEKQQSIYVASEFNPTYNNSNFVKISTFTGIKHMKHHENKNICKKKINGGEFVKFMFCGDWDAYRRLPDYIYRLKLKEGNLVRRDGPDIELFKFNKKEVVCEDYVECSYYVPIISSN